MCERVISSDKDQFKEVYEWELDYFVAEMFADSDMPKNDADRNAVVQALLHFANRAGCFMEIVASRDPSKKWEKKDFDINEFLEHRIGRLDKVEEKRAEDGEDDGDDENEPIDESGMASSNA